MGKRIAVALGVGFLCVAAAGAEASDGQEANEPVVTITSPAASGFPSENPTKATQGAPPGVRATEGINSKGESYGSGLPAMSPAEEPDLISAVGTNGQAGYVRASELAAADPGATSPADAATYRPVRTSVPVYKSDGVTIVGEFKIAEDQG